MNMAVIGLAFGDEGKGLITDYLCSLNPKAAVLRFSGGHQAGHTVYYNGINHVFTNFGSGTLRGCETYWSEFCTFEPRGCWREFNILKSKGVSPIIHIHPNCRVTTPYDIVANWVSSERLNGTCGVGVWKTIERNNNGMTLTIEDIFEDEFMARMDGIKKYYDNIEHEYLIPMLNEFYEAIDQIRGTNNFRLFVDYPEGDNLIFEGSQGILLGESTGYLPHTTPSMTNMWNLFELGYSPDEVFLVTRCYQTRHGEGPMTNEKFPIDVICPNETNQWNEFQGTFRKTMLDLDLLIKAELIGVRSACWRENIRKNLVVTCLDQIEEYCLTYEGKTMTFYNPEIFAYHIGAALKIDGKIYGSYGPYSNTIKEIK